MFDSNKKGDINLIAPVLSNKLGVLAIAFIVMIIVTGLLNGMLQSAPISPRSIILLGSVIQSLLAFIFPAWLVAFLCSRSSDHYLGLSTPSFPSQYGWAIGFMILLTPALNLIVEWNASITFPNSLSRLYDVMKGMEDKTAEITHIILSDYSWWGLASGILIVGCLTGFAEEMCFRGGLQKALTSSGWNVHLSVWTAAFIFSLLHFQFFGFIPRLLLGAAFGYAYYYSGSLFVSAVMHAFNNSIVVVFSWLQGRKLIGMDLDTLGTLGADQIWMAVASITLVFLYTRWFAPLWLQRSKSSKES